MQRWRPEFELVGIGSGSWYRCLNPVTSAGLTGVDIGASAKCL